MTAGNVRIVAVGDVQPNRLVPETLFEAVTPNLAWGDIRYCQLECTISDRGTLRTDVRNPAHRVPPHNISALTAARFNVVSYAGNNNLDYGIDAFQDTLTRLQDNGIDYFGAGDDLEDARRPLYSEVNGVRIGWVNFCSILRDGFEATPTRAGISPLKIKTFYEPLENIYEQPGTPSRTVTITDPTDFDRAMATIRQTKENADVVIGCFHWGIHFTHDLAMYQPEIAYAAIDNGCDLVLGTHPHCLQAIDVYRQRYIFYSLGNFAFEQPESSARKGVAEYLSFYGIPPDDLPTHPHPHHCRLTMMVRIEIQEGRIAAVRCTPVYFTDRGRPEVQSSTTRTYDDIVNLMTTLCAEIGTKVVADKGEFMIERDETNSLDARDVVRNRKNSYPWLQKLASGNRSSR